LRSRSWLIIGIILLGIIATSTFYVTHEMNHVEVTIETNGVNTNVSTKNSLFSSLPIPMKTEMKIKAKEDILDSNSTVESVKKDISAIAKKYNYTADVKIKSQFGSDTLSMLLSVSGTSMVPTLQDGQDIVILKTNNLKVNDIVVAIHPDYGLIVKRLKKIEGNKVYLMSDNRQVEIFTTETPLPDGAVEIQTIKKTPLDTWLPKDKVIGVVKEY